MPDVTASYETPLDLVASLDIIMLCKAKNLEIKSNPL